MVLAGVVAAIFGVKAEGASLEDIAAPLNSVRAAAGSIGDRLDSDSNSVAPAT
jgi:hypothetical protein